MRLAQFAQTLVGERGDLGPEPPELILVGAELLGAVPTVEIAVGRLGKALGVLVEGDLPAGQQGHRQHQQAPGVGLAHEEQRREHHGVVPVVYPAGAAAFVLEEPGLEGAEEKYAYHVAYGIRDTEQEHNALVKDIEHVKRAENSIEDHPYQRDEDRGIVIGDFYFRSSRLYVVTLKLFLATGALIFRRKEPEDHLHGKYDPDEQGNCGLPANAGFREFMDAGAVKNVFDQEQNEKD